MQINTIKKLCQKYGIWPSKRLGQNFLLDKSVVEKIVEAGELKADDVVLEIGPGFGILTRELIKRAGRVVAVEKDKRLFSILKTQLTEHKEKLEIINDDILNVETRQCLVSTDTDYKIISNLPYQITSPVLWKFLQEVGTRHGAFRPESMVLMVQKEVAERIVAKPGQMSVLAVMCQFYAECKKICDVGRENFWPEPEVDSAVIKLKVKNEKLKVNPVKSRQAGILPKAKLFDRVNEKKFFQIVKIGFSCKRKMLKNNLSGGLKIPQEEVIKTLREVGLNEKIRAQELSVKNWVDMFILLDKTKKTH